MNIRTKFKPNSFFWNFASNPSVKFSNQGIRKIPTETELKINKKNSSDSMFFSWLLTNVFIGLLIYFSFIIVVFS